jgi:hydrogenase-4 component B
LLLRFGSMFLPAYDAESTVRGLVWRTTDVRRESADGRGMNSLAILGHLGTLLILSVVGLAWPRPNGLRLVYLGCLASCTLVALAAIAALLGGEVAWSTVLPLGLPWLGSHLRIDALSAFFLVVANGLAAAASLFALGYAPHDSEPHRVTPLYPLFLAGMNLVVIADDAFTFLFAWEFMSFASWLLVLSKHRERGTDHAAFVYLVMAGFGTATLLLAFGLLAGPDGGYDFASMRAYGVRTPLISVLIVALSLIGTGSKAGLVPLHVWLPLAHPAAPSHVSALLSGVMTKVAIYGMVRLLFDLVGPVPWWWGVVITLLGGITAVLGVLYAMMEHDLKRLLAFHTVENIGIIVAGLGMALLFRADGLPMLAALALVAGLFHVLNHALFKSLLFFGAGSVLVATGERDMERLGGLIHRMPRTALAFLIGAAAISALPPLNGFISEWLTFQAVLQSAALPQWAARLGIPVAGILLALGAALAAACFVKAFGVTFLGRARSTEAARAEEVGPAMIAGMGLLAAACVGLGLFPSAAIALLQPVARQLAGASMPAAGGWQDWLWVQPLGAGQGASYSGLLILATVATLCTALVLGVSSLGLRRTRRGPPWDCGYPDANPATQYGASSFAQPIRRVFGGPLFGAREHVDMPAPGEVTPARFEVELEDPAWRYIYTPLARATNWMTARLNPLQFLTIRRYLSFVFAALVLLLSVAALLE